MSINEVRYLPECGSTNAYVKEHFEEFGPVAAVYTQNQTAGRGRLGRSWVNAEGKALYYTVAIKEPLAQPATLPLLASLAVRRQLQLRYGVDCQIKWPNDLLLNGKKIVGILCESVSYGYQQQGRGILCGIGINLAQPQSYFDAADLPHGTSLALAGRCGGSFHRSRMAGGRADRLSALTATCTPLPGTALHPSGRNTKPPVSIWAAGSPLTCRTAVRAQVKPWTWTPRGV